jgi:TonB family protein
MRSCDLHRESDYRRRLRIITLIVLVLMSASLLWLPEDVARQVLTMQFGFQGPTRTLPEITLLQGLDPFEDVRRENPARAMRAFDIAPIEDTGPSEGPRRKKEEPKKEPVAENVSTFDEQYIRHYPAHTDVSYSEDYVILHVVKPVYPADELKHGVEGDVTVEILVNDGGMVDDAWVLVATGSRNFEQATLDAVRQFRFKPPIVQGNPAPMWIRFEIRFRIMG